MKNSNKISEKSEKNRGWLVMVLGGRGAVFRVQCTFPNMERVAMINEEIAVK